jgi:alkanesulfonate monooxygenase SsuD/methylene tetrahydromethanopterin reductase-like flavin-dependent oxidoreductase (luciferase family)
MLVELGIFIQTPVYGYDRAGNPGWEHEKIRRDLEMALEADKAGFRYVLASEHHFLDEYSHLSANDVIFGYLAHATEQIHLLSGIMNPLPQVIHPAKLAETVAMLDNVSGGRFEFGTGRGAGSHEILGFLHHDGVTETNQTKEIWEDVIGEFAKMWMQDEYEGYEGKYWSLPPRKILPKPWKKPHPPMWYAAGNTSSYEMAARKGLGVLGFSVGAIQELEPVLQAYKRGVADAEPVGAYVNDNLLVVTQAFVSEDPERPVRTACSDDVAYLVSNMYRYHDTFPHPDGIPSWPDLVPASTPADVPYLRDIGCIVGDPDHAVEQCRRWEAAGIDQLVVTTGAHDHEVALETIRLFGEHVIPKFDTDPVHRTTRFRNAAAGVAA